MWRRRRTSPPPYSMAGSSFTASGLVGILVGAGLVGSLSGVLGLGGFGLTGLCLLDHGVLGLDLVDRLLRRVVRVRSLSGLRLDCSLRRSRGRDGRGLLRRACLAC